MKERGGAAYRGLIEIVQALSDCSDIFPPLKSACNVILAIRKTADVRSIPIHHLLEQFTHFIWFAEGVNE